MQCPIDGTALVMADRSGVEIDYCPKCRGVWLDRGELDKIIERAAPPMPPVALQEPPRAGAQRQDFRPEPPRQEQRRDDSRRDDPRRDDPRRDDDDDDRRGHDGYGKKRRREGFLGELFDF